MSVPSQSDDALVTIPLHSCGGDTPSGGAPPTEGLAVCATFLCKLVAENTTTVCAMHATTKAVAFVDIDPINQSVDQGELEAGASTQRRGLLCCHSGYAMVHFTGGPFNICCTFKRITCDASPSRSQGNADLPRSAKRKKGADLLQQRGHTTSCSVQGGQAKQTSFRAINFALGQMLQKVPRFGRLTCSQVFGCHVVGRSSGRHVAVICSTRSAKCASAQAQQAVGHTCLR